MQIIKKNQKGFFFVLTLAIGIFIWSLPVPEGLNPKAWHLLAIFIATIVGIVLKPLPMGAIALLGLTASVLTKTLTFPEAFSGFSHEVVWLIVAAFFIARGFLLTGLGSRVAFFFASILGKNAIGLGYGMLMSDLLLAPAIPSTTARTGGILFPILQSLAKTFGSHPFDPSSRKIGAFLTQVVVQGSTITSAMFLTSMAANPLIAQLASDAGVTITWGSWALAAIVPGMISLILLPLVLFKFYPPEMRDTPHAAELSKKKLKELGPMKPQEWVMAGTFCLLIFLWVIGPYIELKAATTAFIGLSILLLTNVLSWNDLIKEHGAWDTLFWFAALVTMASFLNSLGLMEWLSSQIIYRVQHFNWIFGFLFLSLAYFYAHYFFASNIAHAFSMYSAFLFIAIALGTPPALAALTLAFFSSLFGALTPYASGPAPILFGAGFVPIGTWWKLGFLLSLVQILIWLVAGGIWWKFLGIW